MKQLPAALIIEKNKLASTSPWLVLLDITLIDAANPANTTVLRLVRNTENVTFGGNLYTAFPFNIEPTQYSSKGEIPTVTLQACNITRAIQEDLEAYNGGIGSTVLVTVVSAAHLAEDYAELQMLFDVIACTTDATWVTFTLGAPNPLTKRFPLDRYLPNHCGWAFKSCECGYAGVTYTTCNRTYTDCETRGRTARFGGFLGLRSGGVRVV